jgi:nitrous oxidase accessory protein NosD
MMNMSRYQKMTRAAIVLHQASGTVIAGNRIEVEGKSATRHHIYLTDASKDVRIEGNTIVGFDDPVTLLKGSTAGMKDNVFENKKESWSLF